MIGTWPSQFHFHCLLMHLCLVITLAVGQFSGQQVARRELWCVAKKDAENPMLKRAMDWACGPGGADCTAIQPGGPCYDLSDYLKMPSYVFNDYYQKSGQQVQACYFNNTAVITSIDPSQGACLFLSGPRKTKSSVEGADVEVFEFEKS